MLHEADPTTGEADPPDMPRLEQQVQNFPPGAMAGVYFLVILETYTYTHPWLLLVIHPMCFPPGGCNGSFD